MIFTSWYFVVMTIFLFLMVVSSVIVPGLFFGFCMLVTMAIPVFIVGLCKCCALGSVVFCWNCVGSIPERAKVDGKIYLVYVLVFVVAILLTANVMSVFLTSYHPYGRHMEGFPIWMFCRDVLVLPDFSSWDAFIGDLDYPLFSLNVEMVLVYLSSSLEFLAMLVTGI